MSVSRSKLRWLYFGGSGTLAVLAGLILFGTLIILGAALMVRAEYAFAKHGVHVQARIVNKEKRDFQPGPKPGSRKTEYELEYQFEDAAGNSFTGVNPTNERTFNGVQIGQQVGVIYLPDSPGTNRMTQDPTIVHWVAALVIGGVGLLLVLSAARGCANNMKDSAERSRLVWDGVAVWGQVTAINQSAAGKFPRQVRLNYAFPEPPENANWIAGETMPLPRHLRTRWGIGDPICVVYDADNPNRHGADIFGIRSEET